MYRALVFAALLGVAAAVPAFRVGHMSFASEEEALFARFKNEFGRVYFDAKDEDYRMQVFLDNHRMITQHNIEAEQGVHTYTLAMNEFGDMTFEEFHKKYTGFAGERSPYLRSQNTEDLSHIELAASVDWTTKGAVTAVKNQGQCGSCWSFSATGAIEGATYIAKGNLPVLSEQQLMDCSKNFGNNSCEGGLMDYAFEWVIRNGGITSEKSYPYTARDSFSCKSASSVASISSYKDVAHSEDALARAVTQQPVSVAIQANQASFQFYSSGVMTGTCGTQLDHGVLAVGYGTLGGTKYWKVKNSWGGSWGMNGYILMEKGKSQSGGQCGILLSASYPVV